MTGKKSIRSALTFALTSSVVGLSVLGVAGAAQAAPSAATGVAVMAAGDTVAAPNWPGGQCVLSDPHLVFDDENTTNPKASMSWNPSAAAPVDPGNANFHLRSTGIGIANLSAHTYYDTTYFASWFYLRENATTKHNYAAWNPGPQYFDTVVPPDFPWVSGWAPRDPASPGAQASLVNGTLAGNPLAPTIVAPAELGKDSSWTGETRPGYELPDIAPGATQPFTQVMRTERPTNNGAYASLQYRVVSVTTCLPVPTIAQPTVADTQLQGTGTTVGDVITVVDQNGNTLGTATVQSDLTWTLPLGTPLDAAVTTVTATAVDEFSFEGSADAAVDPLPVAPSITDPASVSLSCEGDAIFTTSVTAGVPAPTVTWEQSADDGSTWGPADGAISSDGLTLTVSAGVDDDGMQFRAVATSTAGSATSAPATLTVTDCVTEATPIAPRVIDPSECGVDQTFETTPVTGVTYRQERVGGVMRFTATADDGYVIAAGAQTVWEFDIVETTACPPASGGDALANTGGSGMGMLAGVGAAFLAAAALLLTGRRLARSGR